MTKLTRRNFLKGTVLAGGAIAASSFLPSLIGKDNRVFAQNNALAGTVFITLVGPVRIHTYMAPEDSVLVTSHLIETNNSLVLIDTQFQQAYANELKTYIEGLGKPLERIYLSHEHQDHWSGGQVFDADFVTTDAIAAAVGEQISQGDGGFGSPRTPEGGVTPGTETIDGVTFEFDVVNDAEAPEHLLIKLPQAGAIVVQDLIYNNAHAFPLGNNPNWISVLESLRTLNNEGYHLVLNGHGLPSNFGEIVEAIDYLNFQTQAIANAATAQEAIDALVARYPGYGGLALAGFINFLFQ